MLGELLRLQNTAETTNLDVPSHSGVGINPGQSTIGCVNINNKERRIRFYYNAKWKGTDEQGIYRAFEIVTQEPYRAIFVKDKTLSRVTGLPGRRKISPRSRLPSDDSISCCTFSSYSRRMFMRFLFLFCSFFSLAAL